jgi:hypothetical protein
MLPLALANLLMTGVFVSMGWDAWVALGRLF